VQQFDDALLEEFEADRLTVPLLRLNEIDLPQTDIRVGGDEFKYDRSYPIKGQGAVMPGYLREQVAAGKKPLLVERDTRYYVYFAAGESAGA